MQSKGRGGSKLYQSTTRFPLHIGARGQTLPSRPTLPAQLDHGDNEHNHHSRSEPAHAGIEIRRGRHEPVPSRHNEAEEPHHKAGDDLALLAFRQHFRAFLPRIAGMGNSQLSEVIKYA